MKREFKSAVDWWFYALLALVPLSIFSQMLIVSDSSGLVTLGLVGLVATALPVWLLASTKYVVGEEVLEVSSGPFRWQIPLTQIRNIEPTRSPLSSPALSLDRLRIEYGSGKALMVSPIDKEEFTASLRAT